jgi:hypothetical protein
MAYGSVLSDVVQSSITGTPTQFNDGTGTQIGTLCRAWVSFVGSTGAVTNSFNVSSITRGGAGTYTVNFTNTIPVGYSAVCTTRNGSIAGLSQGTLANTGFSLFTSNTAGTLTDSTDNGIAVFR